jgi:hypothetical protein
MLASIFRPSKNAMQSGEANSDRWILKYELEAPLGADPLMGYTSSSDMRRQIRLEFDRRDDAVAYAEREGIAYRIVEAQEKTLRSMTYSDNFKYARVQPWTH